MNWNPERVLVYRKNPGVMATRHAAPPILARKQRIGIWDLDASAGSLPHVLDAIEDAQTYFSFYCVEAAFQLGLTSPGDHVAVDWKQRTGGSMSRAEAAMNVSAGPIFAAAKPVLAALPIDWLVVVVKSMIADSDDPNPWYNLFATTRGRIVLLSTFDLREYAAEAGRPFEAAVVGAALSMVLQTMVRSIRQIPGTIFDFCENRHDVVKIIRTPIIDQDNRKRIPIEILQPTEKILRLLTQYQGSTSPTRIRPQRKASSAPKKSKVDNVAAKLSKSKAKPSSSAGLPSKRPPLSGVSFNAVLKALEAALPKAATNKRAIAKKAPRTRSPSAGK